MNVAFKPFKNHKMNVTLCIFGYIYRMIGRVDRYAVTANTSIWCLADNLIWLEVQERHNNSIHYCCAPLFYKQDKFG